MRRRGSARELVVITWRDIPAQVNGGSGEGKRQMLLPSRFQRAIDRAAVKAGRKTAEEYVAEWRRYTMKLPDDVDDLGVAVDAEVGHLDEAFPDDRLRALVANGGWDPERRHAEAR